MKSGVTIVALLASLLASPTETHALSLKIDDLIGFDAQSGNVFHSTSAGAGFSVQVGNLASPVGWFAAPPPPTAGSINYPDLVFGPSDNKTMTVTAVGFTDPSGADLDYSWSWTGTSHLLGSLADVEIAGVGDPADGSTYDYLIYYDDGVFDRLIAGSDETVVVGSDTILGGMEDFEINPTNGLFVTYDAQTGSFFEYDPSTDSTMSLATSAAFANYEDFEYLPSNADLLAYDREAGRIARFDLLSGTAHTLFQRPDLVGFENIEFVSVPEPATLAIMCLGLATLVATRRR